MNDRVFVDSNVFVYAIQSSDLAKSTRSAEWLKYLLGSGSGVTNLQVLNEITNVLIKRKMIGTAEIFGIVDGYKVFGAEQSTLETVAAARLLHFETGYSWWDCILMASAMEHGCNYFLTEDLQDGQKVRGLTIVSPFRHSPPHIPLH